MTDKAKVVVQQMKVADLQPYANNSNTHSDWQIKKIADSIREFGFTNPVLATKDKTIIAGHGRVLAAMQVGLDSVPVITLDMTPEKARAYVIADNQLAKLAQWDHKILAAEIVELQNFDYDIDVLGFDDKELAHIRNLVPDVGWPGHTQGNTDPDEVPDVGKNKFEVERGQIWQLGEHRLLCGDSTNQSDVEKLMDGEKANMVFTDPPYGIGFDYSSHDDSSKEANEKLVSDVFSLHDCGKVWTPGLMNLARDISRFGKTKVAVWYKKFAAAGNGIGGASTWEPILILNAEEKGMRNDVFEIMTDRVELNGIPLTKLHSCPKPVALYEHLIESLSKKKSKIFEPFCGSGSTLIACEKTNRKCYGMEIDPHYCSVIIERWQNFTGKKAVKQKTKRRPKQSKAKRA